MTPLDCFYIHHPVPTQGCTEQEIPRGIHAYPFVYQLYPGIPASFKGFDGFVKYSATCTIDFAFWVNKTIKKPITVIGFLDLNRIHTKPVRLE